MVLTTLTGLCEHSLIPIIEKTVVTARIRHQFGKPSRVSIRIRAVIHIAFSLEVACKSR